MSSKPLVLIMAGGSGTRLWPYSRKSKPKQLLKIFSDKTLIEETIDRALKVTDIDRIFIGTNDNFKKLILQDVRNLSEKNFIIEPEAKNTAPIIAYFVFAMLKKGLPSNSPVIVLSADHFIEPLEQWQKNIESVLSLSNDYIWCIGVKPTRPDIGYGYIQSGEVISGGESLYRIAAFKEKPDAKTAKQYLEAGSYSWNSGMFVFSLGLFQDQLQITAPEISILAQNCANEPAKIADFFAQMPDISVDYAVLEKSAKMAVCQAGFTWDDVGSFSALTRVLTPQKENYATFNTKAQYLESHNNIIHSSALQVALMGVNDMVVVEHDGVLLITPKDQLENIKKIRELTGSNFF